MQGMLGKRTSRMSGSAMQAEESRASRKQLRPTTNTEHEDERTQIYSDLQELQRVRILERQKWDDAIQMRRVQAEPGAWPLHYQGLEQQTTKAKGQPILQRLQSQAVIYIAKIVTKSVVSGDLL